MAALRKQIEDQEETIDQLRRELDDARPQSAGLADWEDEKIGLELQIEQYEARVSALDAEQTASAANYAAEIANLKGAVLQYKAQMESEGEAF